MFSPVGFGGGTVEDCLPLVINEAAFWRAWPRSKKRQLPWPERWRPDARRGPHVGGGDHARSASRRFTSFNAKAVLAKLRFANGRAWRALASAEDLVQLPQASPWTSRAANSIARSRSVPRARAAAARQIVGLRCPISSLRSDLIGASYTSTFAREAPGLSPSTGEEMSAARRAAR
jgi:hypothetical protein